MAGDRPVLDVVYFLDADWQKDHRLPYLQEIARYCRLLCIEPPITLDAFFRRLSICREWISGKGRGIRQIGPSLYLYRPIALVPYFVAWRFPTLGRLNRVILGLSLRHALRQLGLNDIILILAHPVEEPLIGLLGERLLCYEVYDEWAAHPSISPTRRRLLMVSEERILRKAAIVFASSQSLAESKRRLNSNTHFIPNAADVEFFARSLDPATPVPEDLACLPEPRIGLIGNINEIVDLDLINYLAEQRPEWSIVLIGRVNGSPRFFKTSAYLKSRCLPNVHYLGWRDYRMLPAYQKGLDVCLLPYFVNDYTVNVYPSKVHQYLAGEKAVVATAMPEMFPLKDVIYIAGSQSEFLLLCDQALQSVSPKVIERRNAVARENSIRRRVASKVGLLDETVRKRNLSPQHRQ